MKKNWITLSISLNVVLFLFFCLWLLSVPPSSNLDIANAYQTPGNWVGGQPLAIAYQNNNAADINLLMEQCSFYQPFEIEMQLNEIDSTLIPSDSAKMAAFVELYTTYSYAIDSVNFSLDSAQHVLNRIAWAQKLDNCALMSRKYSMMFTRISNFWLGSITKWLNRQAEQNYNVIYSFDYQYLNNRLGESRYFQGVTGSDFDKVMKNITEGKFTYVWSKLVHKSVWLQGAVFTFLAVVFSLCFIGLIQIINKIKKK